MFASETLAWNLRVAALAAAVCWPASQALEAAPAAKKIHFGEHTTPNVAALLPMPPDAHSEEEKCDRDASHAVYAACTPEQFALGKAQVKLTVFHFSPSLGAWFQTEKFPKTEALFAQLGRETKALTEGAKKYFQRPRPAQIDPERFARVLGREDSCSYPSFHSTEGTLFALLLMELFPERRAELQAQGREMGWLRVKGGMESPLDVFAGRVLGRALAQALMRNPEFLADLEDVREELAAAGVLPAAAVSP